MEPPHIVQPGTSSSGQMVRTPFSSRPPFGEEPSWGPPADGGIAVVAAAGIAVPRRERSRVVTGGGESATREADIKAAVDHMEFAERIPAASPIVTDRTGRTWVQPHPARVGDPAPVDLISAEGRCIGTQTGQEHPRVVSASGLAAWVETDPDPGVERIGVRRLPTDWR